jgi:hypothetical protein
MPDWLGQASVSAAGMAVVEISHNNAAAIWEIEQISSSVGPASTTGNVVIWKNNNMVAPTSVLFPQIDQFGNKSIGQTAAGLPYVYISASDRIEVVVSNATVNDNLTVRAQYREFAQYDPEMLGR